MIQLCLMCFAMATATLGYPTGAPLEACKDMVPGHSRTTTSGTPPYAINISSNVYSPGFVIHGVLYSTSGVFFRGFLLQARALNDVTSATIGMFVGNTSRTHNECGQGIQTGLTHSDSQNKSSIEFTWTPPDTDHGDIRFRVTVVASYDPSEYWLNIDSDVIKSSSNSSLTTEPPLTGTNTAQMMTTESVPMTTKRSASIQNDPACGKTKGCFPNCENKSCDFLITWQHDSNNALAFAYLKAVTFEIQMEVKDVTNVWVAIGFSQEGKMDKTNVAACVSQARGISIRSSYNQGYSNEEFQDTSLGLLFLNGSVSNGVFRCMFQRLMVQNQSHFYDLSNTYFLLAGTGPVQSGIVRQHTEIPKRSSEKIDFMESGISKEDNTASTLVKLHASLMTVAWVFLSSVGLVVARQCKDILPQTKLLGLKVWFHIHRSSMFCALLCVVAGIVVIFYENDGFRSIQVTATDKEYTKAHPYMGLVVGSLTFLNPVMALFRPKPEANTRFVFNWVHFVVGTSAHLLAIITIVFGIGLEKAKLSNSHAIYVMVAYTVVFVLVELVLELYNRAAKHRGNYTALREEQVLLQYAKARSIARERILLFHVVLMLVLTTYLVIIICEPLTFTM